MKGPNQFESSGKTSNNVENETFIIKLQLKQIQTQLTERQNQYNASIATIEELKKASDDLVSTNDTLRAQLNVAHSEIKILEQKEKSYQNEILTYQQQICTIQKQMNELKLNHQIPQTCDNSQHSLRETSVIQDEYDNGSGINMINMTKKQLVARIQSERNVLKQNNVTIDKLLKQLENQTTLQRENDILKKDLVSLTEMAKEDLKFQENQITKLRREVISLSSKNISLDLENKDLLALLEEKETGTDIIGTSNNHNGLHGSLQHEIDKYVSDDDYKFDIDELETQILCKNKTISILTHAVKQCEDILIETAQKYLSTQVIDLEMSDDSDCEEMDNDIRCLHTVARLKIQISALSEQLQTFYNKIKKLKKLIYDRRRELVTPVTMVTTRGQISTIGTYLQTQINHFYKADQDLHVSKTNNKETSSVIKTDCDEIAEKQPYLRAQQLLDDIKNNSWVKSISNPFYSIKST